MGPGNAGWLSIKNLEIIMNQQKLSSRIDGKLAAYATLAGVALAAPALAPSADATVVYSGPVNLSIPNNFDGVYINLVTGATGTAGGSVPGWNWDPYNSGTAMSFFWNASPNNGGLSSDGGATYAVLPFGASIGGGNTYIGLTSTAAAAGWAAGADAYLGVKILNSATSTTNYGWIHLMTTGNSGFPATIVDWAYENTGASLTAGQVPEPTTFALLGVMAAGALGVRAWRKRKAA
jgi:hypothetical protein